MPDSKVSISAAFLGHSIGTWAKTQSQSTTLIKSSSNQGSWTSLIRGRGHLGLGSKQPVLPKHTAIPHTTARGAALGAAISKRQYIWPLGTSDLHTLFI
jgi:hypothetical protein